MRTSKIAKLKRSSPVESFYSRLERKPVMDEKPRGKLLLVILCVVFLDLVGIGILIPVVPILLAPPAFRDRFSFSRRFCVLYHIHRRLFHQQVQFHFMKHRRFLGVRGFVDRNCPSLYSPKTLEVCRLQSSSCHAHRYGISRPRVLPPQCVVAVAVRGSVFFRCKQALASISYDDCEPLCRRVGSG